MTKTATLPAIRISPALRAQAEHLLGEGETLSAFIVESLEHNIDRRRMQREFIARGLAAADSARAQNRYTPAATVMRRLKAQIDKAKREQADRDKRR
jgi:predicted transcriptional regulator